MAGEPLEGDIVVVSFVMEDGGGIGIEVGVWARVRGVLVISLIFSTLLFFNHHQFINCSLSLVSPVHSVPCRRPSDFPALPRLFRPISLYFESTLSPFTSYNSRYEGG